MAELKCYKIYAGLGGGFGGASYVSTELFPDRRAAEQYAYEVAVEEYDSYGGMHGLYDWDQCREECIEEGYVTEDMSEGDANAIIDEYYRDCMEQWLDYYVKPATALDDDDEEEDESEWEDDYEDEDDDFE